MLYRTHAFFAIGSLWLLSPIPGAISGDNLGVMVALAAVGALLPDLDAARSTAKNLSIKGIQPLAPLANLLHRTLGHRGALHAVSILPVVGVLCAALAPLWGVWPSSSLWLGYASHLALDACTKSGIPKGFRGRERIHLLPKSVRFTTGSMAEDALLPFLAAAVVLLALAYAPHAIQAFP